MEIREQDPRQAAEAYASHVRKAVSRVAEILTGDEEADPSEVFVSPTERRDDQTVKEAFGDVELTPGLERDLREAVAPLGLGGEQDVASQASYQIVEGGKPWKVEAEVAIAAEADTIIFAGSPHRNIGQDEIDYIAGKLPEGVEPGKTELEMVRKIAEMQAGFEPLEEDSVLPFGYDISSNHEFTSEPTGQLVQIGTRLGKPVLLLRVDRENYLDDEGNSRYRYQPNSAALMGLVSQYLTANGDTESAIAIVTSSTYASRAVDTVIAGLENGRTFEVGMYGRETLAGVRGAEVAAPSPINQLPGELRVFAEKLRTLEELLRAS